MCCVRCDVRSIHTGWCLFRSTGQSFHIFHTENWTTTTTKLFELMVWVASRIVLITHLLAAARITIHLYVRRAKNDKRNITSLDKTGRAITEIKCVVFTPFSGCAKPTQWQVQSSLNGNYKMNHSVWHSFEIKWMDFTWKLGIAHGRGRVAEQVELLENLLRTNI